MELRDDEESARMVQDLHIWNAEWQLERCHERLEVLSHLAAELRSALPDEFVSEHLADMVGSPEGVLYQTTEAFKNGRLGEVADE